MSGSERDGEGHWISTDQTTIRSRNEGFTVSLLLGGIYLRMAWSMSSAGVSGLGLFRMLVRSSRRREGYPDVHDAGFFTWEWMDVLGLEGLRILSSGSG